MESKEEKDITKHKVMSEFLEGRVIVECGKTMTILPSNEHLDFHYPDENGKIRMLKISFTQIVDLVKAKQKLQSGNK